MAVGEGKIALHKLLAEDQPDIVNRHLGLLMSTRINAVMTHSTRLNSYVQMRAKVVDLLRAEAALHVPKDVDGALTVNTTPNPRMRRTPAHVIFLAWLKTRVIESTGIVVSLTKQSSFTSSTACRTRPRCCFLHT